MFHLADLAGWGAALLLGCEHVIIPMFDPVGLMKAIEQHQVTDVLMVPLMIQAVIGHPELAEHDLSSLRVVLYGASPIPQAVLERAMKAFPNAGFTQAYGRTEVAPVATLLSPDDHRQDKLLRSAGRAAPHAEVRIVDPDDNEVPRGTVGEVVVRGGHVMARTCTPPKWRTPSRSTQRSRSAR